jgi:hypothetical protein
MMGRAMIAQIEPHDIEAVREQQAAERQHVGRFGAAFPAVQQNRDPASGACGSLGRASLSRPALRGAAQERLQPDAIATIEQQLLRARNRAARPRISHETGQTLLSSVCRCPLRSTPDGR